MQLKVRHHQLQGEMLPEFPTGDTLPRSKIITADLHVSGIGGCFANGCAISYLDRPGKPDVVRFWKLSRADPGKDLNGMETSKEYQE